MALKLSAACIALAGCSLVTDSFVTNEFSGDEFPIDVDLDSGAVLVGLREPGVPDRTAILDVMAPLTIINAPPNSTQSVHSADVYVLAGATPRARLDSVDLVSHHPCSNDDDVCVVGRAGAAVPYEATIGAQALAGDAVRLRLGDEQIFILPDIGGTEAAHTHACDGVFPSPYRGGGTVLLGDTEVGFGGRRIALSACLGANPDPLLPQGQRGTDSLLVMSTSVGVSILGEAAYARYRTTHSTALPLDQLPEETVYLPSGPIVGKRATIDNLALVATSSSDTLAACRQVYANHFMTSRNCVATDDDCPCEENSDNGFCPVPAVVELSPVTGVSVLVVSDDDKSLQALRTELRPNQAEIDGILGTEILRTSEIDVDYPHNRLLARCTTEGCVTRPAIPEEFDRRQAQGCLENAPLGPLF